MARTVEDVEALLGELGRSHEPVTTAPGTFLLRAASGTITVLSVHGPIVTITVTIGPTPEDPEHQRSLYQRLLELNATDLLHSSYGLEDGKIVLSAALALENIDKNELSAALTDIDIALVQHTAELAHVARD